MKRRRPLRERIEGIERAQRQEREAREAKARELTTLRSNFGKCRAWISDSEKKIAELHARAQSSIGVMFVDGHGGFLGFRTALQEEAEEERMLAAYKEFEATLAGKIEAHGKQ